MGRSQDETTWEKRLRRAGLALGHLERFAIEGGFEGVELLELRFKLDADNRTSVLCVLKAQVGDERVVGFVGGLALTDVVIATAKKLVADAIRWREDRPWQG